jgi:hypothetical protein
MTTYVFSWDGKESWPLMPDTEFVIESSLKRDNNSAVVLKGGQPVKEYYVLMDNPSRTKGNGLRRLCLLVCDTEEQAIKELRECVEKILATESGIGK